jgi:hypothetical protein
MLRRRRSGERRAAVMAKVDAAFFTFSAAAAVWLGYILLREGVDLGWQALLLVVFWGFVAYLLLPRVHRILTRLYVPGYFIGRTRTSDGLLGDPVNLALLGSESQVHAAMTDAGWIRADDLDFAAGRRIVTSTLQRRSYPEAPVSPLHLFDRQQDFAFQQEVAGSPSKRHHVRFWRCPDGWMLPGGYQVDWLAAGTYDRSVGLSLFTLQITHKIDENTDVERDFVVMTVCDANPAVDVRVIENFSTGYHDRNGGGDRIETDGDLPIIDLTNVAAREIVDVAPTDSRDRRPAPTDFGAGVALLRGLIYVAIAAGLLFAPQALPDFVVNTHDSIADPDLDAFEVLAAVVLLVAAIVDIGLGMAVLAARNWARLVLMTVCVFSTVGAFSASVRGEDSITPASLPTLASSILVLLALSSHAARDYAQSRHRA